MVLFNTITQILVIAFVNLVCAQMNSIEVKEHAKQSFVSLLKNIIDVNEKRVLAMKKLNHLQDFIMNRNSLSKMHGFDIGEDDSSEGFKSENEILALLDRRNILDLTLRRSYKNKKESVNNNINIIIPFNSFNVRYESRTKDNDKFNIRSYNDAVKDHYRKVNSENDDNSKMSKQIIEDTNNIYDDILLNSRKVIINYDANSNDNDTEMHIDNSDLKNNIDISEVSSEKRDEIYKRAVDDSDSVNRRRWKGSSCDKSAAKVCKKACVRAFKNGCTLYKCSRRAKKAFKKECKKSCKSMFITGQYSDSDWEYE